MTRWSNLALSVAIIVTFSTACNDVDPDEHPQPGLVVLTPRAGVGAGGQGSILLRSDQPSRVVLRSEGETIGTARAGRSVTTLRFSAPDWVPSSGNGGTRAATIIAVAEGGTTEQVEVILVGLVPVDQQVVDLEFFDIAAINTTAALAAPSQLWATTRGDDAPHPTKITGLIQAIATADAWNGVAIAGADAFVTMHPLSDGSFTMSSSASFHFADYDGSSLEVDTITSLQVTGLLVAAATARGMAIMDGAVVDEAGVFCRRRSAMTTRLSPATYDGAMAAVVVTNSERVIAGGAYVNVYEAYDNSDLGGCDSAMANRGTSVISPPADTSQPWGAVAMAVTSTALWIGRHDQGVLRVPLDFMLVESRYFRDDDLQIVPPESLPLPHVVDLSSTATERIWVALSDPLGVQGGVLRLDAEGSDLWVDGSVLGGVPVAVDVASSGHIWVLTETTVSTFTDPN